MNRFLSVASLAAGLFLAVVPPAAAQTPGAKAINTGGPQGAYHTLFCPPIPVALAGAYFQGYACTASRMPDATAVINAVAESTDGAVGFFVQFADPQNGNIRLMAEKGLRIIPVVSREILRTRVADQAVYEVQTFTLGGGGAFARPRELTTACTPVAIFGGAPEALAVGKGVTQDDQRELIAKVRAIPAQRLLPQESRVAALIANARRLSAGAAEQLAAAAETTKRAVERQFNN